MRCVELFTGAGGLALGLGRAGIKHAAVIERDPDSCRTIRVNQRLGNSEVSGWPLHEVDVRQFDFSALEGKVEIVAGGPPCQPFSLGGKHKGPADARDMFPQAARAVRELRPRAFVFENVKGLLREAFADYFQYTLLQLQYPETGRRSHETWREHSARLQRLHTEGRYDGLRYRVVFGLLNGVDFGVPQRRERVVIVGFRFDVRKQWSFPKATHFRDALLYDQWVSGEYWERHAIPNRIRPPLPEKLSLRVQAIRSENRRSLGEPWRTVRDAVSGLPAPTTSLFGEFANHVLNPGARAYPGHTGSLLDEPAKTLKAGDHGVPGGENMVILSDGSLRYFTVRESARLQTFPDNFVFPSSWTESMRQIGNAVPVALAEAVGRGVMTCLRADPASLTHAASS